MYADLGTRMRLVPNEYASVIYTNYHITYYAISSYKNSYTVLS